MSSLHIFCGNTKNMVEEVDGMKQEEKKPITWEVTDPKPPVIQSGHMEGKKHFSY